MSELQKTEKSGPEKSGLGNGTIVAICCSFVIGMVGMAYAAVPLYEMFCKVTGYGGTTQRVEQASDVILDRTIKVRFDANVGPGLAWSFEPVQREVELKIGETVQVLYKARNNASTPTTGQATFNVTPQAAGAYFNKVQCFCFTETTLKPGEELEMPVVFFVDPAIVEPVETKGIHTLTLSYTFYPHEASKPVASAAEAKVDDANKL
ncbi:cytochrome c oxidase assembly protein [Shinella yambaruensis]|uniref:Cytochrome c oxidase assembly protein CtaG n=1 Tax=Shinella yambaruensis TaxID=415996 RepID=A0ABQ5ZQZ6_9HYPH|nr:cytochrome c oxidase assembly protein [Shinella yambaruensis]MCJ8026391.1 cytochrome c oxidase assembly protein [Shinella yambaruensis]MCU7981798.1 cytochrome c oxidase assembly protein [Shinella yambaruensis]GLR54020.1 cytochrome c oxidase assembly protein CtaG [Shinella yambaruensis]